MLKVPMQHASGRRPAEAEACGITPARDTAWNAGDRVALTNMLHRHVRLAP
jgi:hypothetical protein